MQVNVLGTPYNIVFKKENEDAILKGADGYTDKTTKEIVILDEARDGEDSVSDFARYKRATLRHELIHAFLNESGLGASAEYGRLVNEHPEMMIDWFALQFPKILKAYEEAECLD